MISADEPSAGDIVIIEISFFRGNRKPGDPYVEFVQGLVFDVIDYPLIEFINEHGQFQRRFWDARFDKILFQAQV